MSYTISMLISVVLISSPTLAMLSLKELATGTVLRENLATDNLPMQDFDDMFGSVYCKDRLPESYSQYLETSVLQKRTVDEKEYTDFTYPCKQVTQDAGSIIGMTFVGQSQLAVVSGRNGCLQWWDTDTLNLLAETKTERPYGRLVSSRSGRFVVGRNAGYVALISTTRRAVERTILFEDRITVAGLSPDDRFLAAGTEHGVVWLYDLNQELSPRQISVGDQKIDEIRVTNEGIIAVSCNHISMIGLQDSEIRTISVSHDQYKRWMSSTIVDDTTVAVCFSHKTIKLVDLKEGAITPVTLLTGEDDFLYDIRTCCFSKDSRLLILAETEKLSLWKRSDDGDGAYSHMKDFYGETWFHFMAIRQDNLAYLASELHGGLRLYSVAQKVVTVGLKRAKVDLAEVKPSENHEPIDEYHS